MAKRFGRRGRLLYTVLLLATCVTGVALIAYHQPAKQLTIHTTKPESTAKTAISTQQTPSPNAPSATKSSSHGAKSLGATTTQPTADSSSPSTTNPNPSSSPASIRASLAINGQAVGTVSLANTSNQCDVLTQALHDGLISSLTMRYSQQYQTNAVYSINGQGDPDAVWWAYRVNGKSPPRGCSSIAVHEGDNINWEYVRN